MGVYLMGVHVHPRGGVWVFDFQKFSFVPKLPYVSP
jgi:hypothetical protein